MKHQDRSEGRGVENGRQSKRFDFQLLRLVWHDVAIIFICTAELHMTGLDVLHDTILTSPANMEDLVTLDPSKGMHA